MKREEFKQLFDNHFDAIRSYVYYRSGDAELATDIAQEVFMKLWEKQFDIENAKLKGLLYKIAGDIYVSKVRRRKVEENYCKWLNFDDRDQSAEEQLNYKELLKDYEKALTQLPEKQRTVFLMSRVEELKYYEIAERLNISEKAVEKRMHNAISFLRSALQR